MPYCACRPPSTAWFPSSRGAGTAEPDACAVFQSYGATGRGVVPTVVYGEPRSFDLVLDTNSISISNQHSKGVLMQGLESLGTCADEGERKEESGRETTVIEEVVLVK